MDNTTLSTKVENLRTVMNDAAIRGTANEESFERYPELRDWYTDALRAAIEGDRPAAPGSPRAKNIDRIVSEAWELILDRVGIEKVGPHYASNAARHVAFDTPKLRAAIENEARVWTADGTATAPYREDVVSRLVEAASQGVHAATVEGTEAPISGLYLVPDERIAYDHSYFDENEVEPTTILRAFPDADGNIVIAIRDHWLLGKFAKHLQTLPGAAKTAERKELGVRSDVLRAKAGNVIDAIRFGELGAQPEDWQVKRNAKGKKLKYDGNVTRAQREAVRRLAVLEREPMLDDVERAERDRLRAEVGDLLAIRDAARYGDENIEIATADLTASEAFSNIENPWQKVADLLGVLDGEEAQAVIAHVMDVKSDDGFTSLCGKDLTAPEGVEAASKVRNRLKHAASKVEANMPQIQSILSELVAV